MSKDTTTDEVKYPECERLAAVHEKSQVCGEFLEWLESVKKVELVVYGPGIEYVPVPFRYDSEHLLAEFFGIDLNKVEAERRAMLESIRRRDK